MLKKIVSMSMALVFCLTLSVGVCAESVTTNAPQKAIARFINELSVSNLVDFSGGEVIEYSEVRAGSYVTRIEVTHVLQKKSGSRYRNVSGTQVTRIFHDNSAEMEDSFEAERGATYRVKTTVRVTGPDGTDTHTRTSKSKTN